MHPLPILLCSESREQNCSRKSLSGPGLESVYVVSIPGAVPSTFSFSPETLGMKKGPKMGLAAIYKD